MRILQQSDNRWKNVKIGKSNLTLGGWGCTITALSMLSDWYGDWKTPEWIAKNLDFTSGGLIIWKSMNGKLPMNFKYRYYSNNPDKIREILLSDDEACILQVNSNHWVTLLGYSKILGWKIADPIDGKIKHLSQTRYKITGFTEVTRKWK